MPQMAPMSWFMLFFSVLLTLFIFNSLNYFCFFKKKNNLSTVNDFNLGFSNLNFWNW